MDVYIYGSIVRGELDDRSDIDVLTIVNKKEKSIASKKLPSYFTIYSQKRIKEYYDSGSLFAWHLYQDSKLIYSDGSDYLSKLGEPNSYRNQKHDLDIMINLLNTAVRNVRMSSVNIIYELGIIYAAIRNIGIIASWFDEVGFSCSRYVPFMLKNTKFPFKKDLYETLINCRHATTRGTININFTHITKIKLMITPLIKWAEQISNQILYEK
ncbi:MAG: nucleotidyltransferase domain-containing protein [Bacteroidetes bacterium]|nr:nucleotidyltransferase domain-containing protein [Bacteroidota bacterium]